MSEINLRSTHGNHQAVQVQVEAERSTDGVKHTTVQHVCRAEKNYIFTSSTPKPDGHTGDHDLNFNMLSSVSTRVMAKPNHQIATSTESTGPTTPLQPPLAVLLSRTKPAEGHHVPGVFSVCSGIPSPVVFNYNCHLF